MVKRSKMKRRILIGSLKGPNFARIAFSKHCIKTTKSSLLLRRDLDLLIFDGQFGFNFHDSDILSVFFLKLLK